MILLGNPADAAGAPIDASSARAQANLAVGTATCPPNSETATLLTSSAQCIAELLRGTRGFVNTGCITDSKALVINAEYKASECHANGIQAEAIAQARAIVQLNAKGVYGDRAVNGGITTNLQWETVDPNGGRPDLLLYDRGDPNGPVGLVEMKVNKTGDGRARAEADLQNYEEAFGDETPSGREVNRYKFPSNFEDSFRVTFSRCKYDASRKFEYLYHTYSLGAAPGVLLVDQSRHDCPTKNESDAGGGGATAFEGAVGLDEDHNNNDDMLDAIAKNPRLKDSAATLPRSFVRLDEPVRVHLDRDALAVIVDTLLAGGEGAWPGILTALTAASATAGGLIARGAAVEAGMTAAEMALAQSLFVEAAFITVPTALLVTAVLAGVLAGLLALHYWNILGDPHLATLDGLTYDLQSVGEFHALQVPGADLDIQTRLTPMSGKVSQMEAVAFRLNEALIEIHRDGTLLVNGEPRPNAENWFDFGAGAAILRQGSKFLVIFPGEGVTLAVQGQNLSFKLPKGTPTRGLLGNNDGNPANDLFTVTGDPVTDPTPAVLHGRYADSWRINNEQSLFSYPEDMGTENYTDKTFPDAIVTLASFSAAELNAAATVCNDKGVVDGPQFDDCMLDVASTGDQSYATTAAANKNFLQDLHARQAAVDGTLTENFDGSVPPNFRPASTVPVPGGAAAGPIFDKSGYRFTVPALPSHTNATASLDIYAFGLRDAASSGSIKVTMADVTPVVISLTPTDASVVSGAASLQETGQGQLAAGAYHRYRLTVASEHFSDQLRVSIDTEGFRGVLGTSVAVDDIAVQLTLMPAQQFAIGATVTVSDGQPGPGAGRLETKASHDVYTFAVTGAGVSAKYLDMNQCPPGLTWNLRDSTGARVKSGDCADTELRNLWPGTYALDIEGNPDTPAQATYTFTMTPTAPDIDAGILTIGGGVKTLSTVSIRQNATLKFSGTQGQRIQLETSGSTFPHTAYWAVDSPNGTSLYGTRTGNLATSITTLPATGTYTFYLDPTDTDVGSISVKIWTAASDVDGGTIAIDGPAKTLTTTVAGQNATIKFTGTQGQRVQLQTSASTFPHTVYWAVGNPNGTSLYGTRTGNATTDTTTLPAAGMYTFYLDPTGADVGSISVKILTPPVVDIDGGTMAIDGPAKTLTTTVAGQNATVKFSGTQGQRIQLQTSGSTFPHTLNWAVGNPNGASLYGTRTGNATTDITALPATGTYTFYLDPTGADVGSIDVKIWTAATDVDGGTMAIDGPAKTLTTTVAGQNATVKFSGTQGQRIQLQTSGSTFPLTVYWAVGNPNGSSLYGTRTGNQTLPAVTLPATGTYTFYLDPTGADTGSMTIRISNG